MSVIALGAVHRQDCSTHQVSSVVDILCGAEVGRDTDTFQHLTEAKEASDGIRTRKVVLACLDGRHSSRRQGGSEELNMLGLISGNNLEVVVHIGGVASGGEGGLVEAGDGLRVEGRLEVLEDQGARCQSAVCQRRGCPF